MNDKINIINRQNIQKVGNNLLLFLAAVWSCLSLVFLFSDAQVYAPLGLLLSPVIFSFYRILRKKDRNTRPAGKICCLLLAVPSSFALYLSADISQQFYGMFASLSSLAIRAFCIAGIALLLYALYISFCLFCLQDVQRKTLQPLSKKWFFILWALFFCIWFILYLVCFYPGTFSPDNAGQLYIVEGTKGWSNHQPVLHTLLLYITMRLTGYRPVFHIALQTLAITALLSYTCVWMRRRPVSKLLWYVAFLYFLAHPIFAINSFSFIKDPLFSCAVLFFTLCVADVIMESENRSVSRSVCLCISSLLVLLLRNNGFVIIILTYIALLIFTRGQRFRLFLTGGISLLSFAFTQVIILRIFDITQTSAVEALGIPLQQLCSVIAEEKSYSDDIMQYLNRILPLDIIASEYSPIIIDPIKFHEQFSGQVIESDLMLFVRMWARGFVQHPLTYIKSYLCITEFLWDPMQKAGMIESSYISPHFTFFAPSPLIPRLSSLYMAIVNLSQYSRYAFLTRPFWNGAVMYIFSSLCAVTVMLKKRAKLLIIFIPVFALWASLMISTPIATGGRYILSVFYCAPVFACLAFANNGNPAKKEQLAQSAPIEPTEG